MLLYCLMKKPRGGVEPPACVNETQMPPWQKLSLAQFLLRKFLGGTGSKHFNILVILGKKTWLWLQSVAIPKKQHDKFSKSRENYQNVSLSMHRDTDLVKPTSLIPVTPLKIDFSTLHLKETASTQGELFTRWFDAS